MDKLQFATEGERLQAAHSLRNALEEYRRLIHEGYTEDEDDDTTEYREAVRRFAEQGVHGALEPFRHEERIAPEAFADEVIRAARDRPYAVIYDGHVTILNISQFHHIEAPHVLNLDDAASRGTAEEGRQGEDDNPPNPLESKGPWDELELWEEGWEHSEGSPYPGELRLTALLSGPGRYRLTRDIESPPGSGWTVKDVVERFVVTEEMSRDARRTILDLFARTIGPVPSFAEAP